MKNNVLSKVEGKGGELVLKCWAGHRNFGDELSAYIVGKITGRIIKTNVIDGDFKCDLFAIGSILYERALFSGARIWGAGVLNPEHFFSRRLHTKIFPLTRGKLYLMWADKFNRSTIYALRGPLTFELVKQCGFTDEPIYGDPGITMPDFYTPKSTAHRYTIGIVLHQTHQFLFNPLHDRLEKQGVRLIDINREGDLELEAFADEICSCRYVLSTSLHGLIIAQAYGIPARHFTLAGTPIHSNAEFKFKDYFAGTGQEYKPMIELQLTDLLQIKKLLPRIEFLQAQLSEARTRLLQSFPRDLLPKM